MVLHVILMFVHIGFVNLLLVKKHLYQNIFCGRDRTTCYATVTVTVTATVTIILTVTVTVTKGS